MQSHKYTPTPPPSDINLLTQTTFGPKKLKINRDTQNAAIKRNGTVRLSKNLLRMKCYTNSEEMSCLA